MDTNGEDSNGDKFVDKVKPVSSVDSPKALQKGETEDYDESESLLPPRKGGLSRKSGKPRLKVQWNDRNGNKLAEILEFQPSDPSDSDDEDSDACMCSIM